MNIIYLPLESLIDASKSGKADDVESLVKQGADVNFKQKKFYG